MGPAPHFPQAIGCDVRVNLSGRHRRMTQEFLHHTDIGATFEEMGGEAVSQGVGRNIFI